MQYILLRLTPYTSKNHQIFHYVTCAITVNVDHI